MISSLQKPISSGFNSKSNAHEITKDVDLNGKIAIVTGGYSGIGLETTRELVSSGAEVIIPAKRSDVAIKNLDGIVPKENIIEMDLSDLKASTGLMWISLIVYGVWHAAPFAFVIFYAGLQTLPADQLEAAQIDGATRTQQVRYVVLPHLMPLVSFVALIQLMDNFRVFEPIVGFNASAHAQSLSWFIFNDLGGETRQLSSASATSVLTIIGVTILLLPVLRRTWRDFMEKAK